jgi:hypothetical protein
MTTGSQAVSSVADALAAARRHAYAVLEHVVRGTRTVVNSFNGELATVLDALEAAGDRLTDVRLHRMLAPRPRPSIRGEVVGTWPCAARPGARPGAG